MILKDRSSPETVQRSQQSHTHTQRKSITEDLITVSALTRVLRRNTVLCCFSLFHHSHYCFLHTLNHTLVCNKFRHVLWGGGGGLLKGILGNVGTTCNALNINCPIEEHFAGCRSDGRRPWKLWNDQKKTKKNTSLEVSTGEEVQRWQVMVSWQGVWGGHPLRAQLDRVAFTIV